MKITRQLPSICLAVLMLISGGASLALVPSIRETFARLELPLALAMWLGVGKLAGAVVLLLPARWRRRSLTDWTYAGFVFLLSGAVVLHVAAGDAFAVTAAPALLLALAVLSYALEVQNRTGGA